VVVNTGANTQRESYLAARPFRRLLGATAVAFYLLIIAGGVVRVTGSGLGCPDWPLCHGGALPPAEVTAMIEFTHRAVAVIAGGLLIATLVEAWRTYRHVRAIAMPLLAAVALMVLQVPLGGVIVATELEPLVVAFHLGMAMLIFAAVLAAAAAGWRPVDGWAGAPRSIRTVTWAALAALFVVLLTGALVVGNNAQLACPDWPLCNGGLLPEQGASPLVAVQLLHRYSVAAVSVLVLAVIGLTLRHAHGRRSLRGWALTLGALFAVQVGVWAVQVVLRLPAFWRALHVAAASGVWAALVLLVALTTPTVAIVQHREEPASTPPLVTNPAQK
jgi:heme A synthase